MVLLCCSQKDEVESEAMTKEEITGRAARTEIEMGMLMIGRGAEAGAENGRGGETEIEIEFMIMTEAGNMVGIGIVIETGRFCEDMGAIYHVIVFLCSDFFHLILSYSRFLCILGAKLLLCGNSYLCVFNFFCLLLPEVNPCLCVPSILDFRVSVFVSIFK